MIRTVLEGEDSKPDSPINHILKHGLGIPLSLDAAPTTSGGQLPLHGDCGWYSANLYINLGGNVYSISLTLV